MIHLSFPDQTPYQYGYNNPVMFKDPSGLKGEFPCPGLPCEGYGGSADGVKAFNNDGSENITNKPKTTPSGGGTGENPVGAPTIQSTQEHVNRFNREFHEDLGRTRESVGNDMPGVGELFTGMSGSDYRGSRDISINGNGARAAGNGNSPTNNPSFDNAVKEFNALINRLPEFVGPTPKEGGIIFEKTYSFSNLVFPSDDGQHGIPSSSVVSASIDFHVRVIRAPILDKHYNTLGYNDKIEISATASTSSFLGPLRGDAKVLLIQNDQIVSSKLLIPEVSAGHSLISEGSLYLGLSSFTVPITGYYSYQNYQLGVIANVILFNGGWSNILSINKNFYIK